MAHSLSSKKRIRQNAKKRASNRARRSVLKSKLRSTTRNIEAAAAGNAGAAQKDLHELVQTLDREANRGLIHRNAAARLKSRLAKKLNAKKK